MLRMMLLASIDWGCAVQIAAAINIGNQNFLATQSQTLYVLAFVDSAFSSTVVSFVYVVFAVADVHAAGSMWGSFSPMLSFALLALPSLRDYRISTSFSTSGEYLRVIF